LISRNGVLTRVNLRGNAVGPAGVDALVDGLSVNRSVTHFQIDDPVDERIVASVERNASKSTEDRWPEEVEMIRSVYRTTRRH